MGQLDDGCGTGFWAAQNPKDLFLKTHLLPPQKDVSSSGAGEVFVF